MENKKISTGLGTIILVIILITTLVFVWQYENKRSKNVMQIQTNADLKYKLPQQLDSTVLQEVGRRETNISTANWKFYKNDKYGYSVKYPSEWESDYIDGASFYANKLRKPGEKHPSFGNVISDSLEGLQNLNGDYFTNISVYGNIGDHASLKEWRKYDGNSYKEVLIKGYPALKFDEKPHISFDGKNKDIAGSLRYYFIDNNGNGYEITVWYKDASNDIGEKIISTLTFSK